MKRTVGKRVLLGLQFLVGYSQEERLRVDGGHDPLAFRRTVMEAQMVLDHLAGRTGNAKRLTGLVVPHFASEATALRVLHTLARDGLIQIAPNDRDRRHTIVTPSDALVDTVLRQCARAIARADRLA